MRCVVRLIVSWTRQKQRIHLFGVGQTDPHFQPLKITLLSYVHLYANLYLPLTCGGGGARLGQKPPIVHYENLMSMDFYKGKTQVFFDGKTQPDLQPKNSFLGIKDPLK